jgi:outer membrane protein assembly factor BamB
MHVFSIFNHGEQAMSLAHDQLSSPTTKAPSSSRWWIPLTILVLFAGIFAIPWVALAMNVELGEAAIPVAAFTQYLAPMLAVLLLVLWWIFLFRGVAWLARLALLATAVAGVFAFLYFGVRKFEMTMGTVSLVPRFHWVWEPSPEDNYASYLKSDAGDLPSIDATVGPEDFPSYRGPKQDGIISFIKLNRDWKTAKPTIVWRHPCPEGYSGAAVAGNIVVTLEQRGDKELVACYDRATGRPRWEYPYAAIYKDENKMGDGPRSTPTIHDKHVFIVGASGDLVCLTVEGKLVWAKNILELAKAKNVKWGLTGSPLIVDDLVIANAGIDPKTPIESSLIAFDKATGDVRWQVGKRKAGYSSPQLVKLGNVPQILLFDGEGLVSYDPKTGKELWQFEWITDFEMNSIQPVIIGDDRVFISSEASNGCALLRAKPPEKEGGSWSVETVWKNKNLASRYANPVTDGKFIYGLHDMQGTLRSLDVSDGRIKWRGKRWWPGQLLLVDDLLLVVNGKTGDVSLFDTAASEPEELTRFTAFTDPDKTWNTPALAGDQLFLRNQAEIVCVKLSRR